MPGVGAFQSLKPGRPFKGLAHAVHRPKPARGFFAPGPAQGGAQRLSAGDRFLTEFHKACDLPHISTKMMRIRFYRNF